jgi:hypothetical protein
VQIISVVQRSDGSGLAVPGPDALAAGPFIVYPQYVSLMRACWSHAPEGRPSFASIVEQLSLMLAAELAPAQAAAAAAASKLPRARSGRVAPEPGTAAGRPPQTQAQQQQQQQQQEGLGARHQPRMAAPTAGGGSGSAGRNGLAAALPPGIAEDAEGAVGVATSPAVAEGPLAPPPSITVSGSTHSRIAMP